MFIFCIVFLTSCNMSMTKIVYNKKKPFNFYYTNEVAKLISLENAYTATIMETNLFHEKVISNEDKLTIQSFLKGLKRENFINKPSDLPNKPEYKIYINFKKNKYVINVYNNKYVSIYPWDGDFEMDYVNMSDTSVSDNLFYLCSYIISGSTRRAAI